ncbi:amidohydrolase family protein [Streptomyces sp. CRN 30]|uniref:amidohydrolase family protein n=1 Tax=Streptomyces sp. CRN 30 TaxID=3075613 RepID=UPI002A7F9864|nr:amidohydrolase family protein [Streptomyces sp. CRN 30]
MIDVHVHLADARCLSPGFVAGIGASIGDDSRVGRALSLYLRDRDGRRLLSRMTAHGIAKSVLLIADFGPALGEPPLTVEEIHEHHAAVAGASGGRLTFFAGFDPARGERGLDLVRRWTAEPECEGVKLYPPCGFELDDERLLPLWRHCNDNNVPVLTHSGPSLPVLGRPRRYPDSLQEVLRRFPDLRVALAHGMIWDLDGTVQLLQRHPANLYADISSFHQLSAPDLDRMLDACAKVPDQVLFGSDAPLFDFSGSLGDRIEEMRRRLTPTLRTALFEANARSFLYGTRTRV